MSWDEFKAHVDAKLAEAGRDGSIEIFYLDTGNFPTESSGADAYADSEGLVVH